MGAFVFRSDVKCIERTTTAQDSTYPVLIPRCYDHGDDELIVSKYVQNNNVV